MVKIFELEMTRRTCINWSAVCIENKDRLHCKTVYLEILITGKIKS